MAKYTTSKVSWCILSYFIDSGIRLQRLGLSRNSEAAKSGPHALRYRLNYSLFRPTCLLGYLLLPLLPVDSRGLVVLEATEAALQTNSRARSLRLSRHRL